MNPFVGDAPYGAADRSRLFGREELSDKLADSILASRWVTVYGPRDSGKTSLLHGSVFPSLVDSEDARVVRVDRWPADEDPVLVFARAMHRDLRLEERSESASPREAVLDAAKRAVRASSRLVLISLDQVEQLLYVDRPVAPTETFLECIDDLLGLLLRSVRIIFSLREEDLGRFLDRLRGHLCTLEHHFRVAPLTVTEMTAAVCKIAAAGDPPQRWSYAEMKPHMMEMRVHNQPAIERAEVRHSYAQLFCQTLFEQRAAGDAPEAPAIKRKLSSYVERTVVDLSIEDALAAPIEGEPAPPIPADPTPFSSEPEGVK